MPTISNQIGNTVAANSISGISNAGRPQSQPAQVQGQPDQEGASAYNVELSNAGVQAQSTEAASKKGTVSNELIEALNNDVTRSQQEMLQVMTQHNLHIQSMFSSNATASFNFYGTSIPLASSDFELPQVGETPEAAQKAISDGGAYSVNAVSDRIFSLAEKIAGGDPNKLEKMRSAVEKGFEQAGAAFRDMTGKKDMPQITQDTHAEIMKRFDDLSAKLTGASASTTPAEATKAATTTTLEQ